MAARGLAARSSCCRLVPPRRPGRGSRAARLPSRPKPNRRPIGEPSGWSERLKLKVLLRGGVMTRISSYTLGVHLLRGLAIAGLITGFASGAQAGGFFDALFGG